MSRSTYGTTRSCAALLAEHDIDTLYHLGSILSALAERERALSWRVNFEGLYNVLEASVELGLERVIVRARSRLSAPRPRENDTPNDTIQKPTTSYGISKVFGELMGNYYHHRLGLDVRGVRLPGIVSLGHRADRGHHGLLGGHLYGAILE